MNVNEIKKTHEEITEKATVGVKGYTLLVSENYDFEKSASTFSITCKLWNGDCWDGVYSVAECGEMTAKSEFGF